MAMLKNWPIPVPISVQDYDYTRTLTRSRVAWEYLRRRPEYVTDWRQSGQRQLRPVRLVDGTKLLRLRRRPLRAEAWGLCTFRRSST